MLLKYLTPTLRLLLLPSQRHSPQEVLSPEQTASPPSLMNPKIRLRFENILRLCHFLSALPVRKTWNVGFIDKNVLPITGCLSPKTTFKHSPLRSWPLMDQQVTVISMLNINKIKFPGILRKSFISARVWSVAQEWLFLMSQRCNRRWGGWGMGERTLKSNLVVPWSTKGRYPQDRAQHQHSYTNWRRPFWVLHQEFHHPRCWEALELFFSASFSLFLNDNHQLVKTATRYPVPNPSPVRCYFYKVPE